MESQENHNQVSELVNAEGKLFVGLLQNEEEDDKAGPIIDHGMPLTESDNEL